MNTKPYINKRLIRVALGEEVADLVLKDGKVFNSFTREVTSGDIAIAEGRIAAVGDVEHCTGEDTEVLNAEGYILVPGLIEPHIHPEVTKLTPTRFAEAVLARGTTSVMCSFDQIGVVVGIEGIRFVLDELSRTPLKIFHSGPSRLPYTTPASTVAHSYGTSEHDQSLEWPESVGMWEYMIESIVRLEEPVLAVAGKLLDSFRCPQGHLPFTEGPLLDAAMAAGAYTDHESWFAPEVAEKIRAGLYVFLRKASCVDNIVEGIKVVTEMSLPSRRLSLCSDDIDCTDLVELGHMDHYLRYAIELGVDPAEAVQMCTLNAAEGYRVDHLVGSITPGRIADVLFVRDLSEFEVEKVIADGRLIAENGKLLETYESPEYPGTFFGTMRLNDPITEDDIYLTVPEDSTEAEVVLMYLETIQIRSRREVTLSVKGGRIQPDIEQDALYISVTDRHSGLGKTASAFVGGFGLTKGAFASSLSPDDDNVICIGASVDDMVVAINHLFEIDGGQCVVVDGKVVEDLELPVCGFMTDKSAEEIAEKERVLRQKLFDLGVSMPRPFFSIIFLSITAIPEFAVTDQGFVEAATRVFIDPVLSHS